MQDQTQIQIKPQLPPPITTETKSTFSLIFKTILTILAVVGLITLGVLNNNAKGEVNKNLELMLASNTKLESINPSSKEGNLNKYNSFNDKVKSSWFYWDFNNLSSQIKDNNNNANISYDVELKIVKNEFLESLEAWKSGISADKDFVGKDLVLADLVTLNTEVGKINNVQDLNSQKTKFKNLQSKYSAQLELYNKKALIEGLKAGEGDISSLIEYFKKYPELAESLKKIEKYQAQVNLISQDSEINKYTFQQLDDLLNNDIRPLLSQAIDAKVINEEKLSKLAKLNTNPTTIPVASGKAILISKSKQFMYIFEDGKLIRDNPITTGRTNWPTDTGNYSVLTKERNRRLQGSGQGVTWNVFVKYWMLFNAAEEEGIHDASWRNGNFGGPDYVTNGSRGCVNTPDETMEWLFNWASIGTPVIVED